MMAWPVVDGQQQAPLFIAANPSIATSPWIAAHPSMAQGRIP